MTKTLPTSTHPGELVRALLDSFGVSISEAVADLGVSRPALSRIVNSRSAISPDMALRLEAWLQERGGPTAIEWVKHQAAYDLEQARASYAGDVKPLRRPA